MCALQIPAVDSDTKVTLYHKYCSCHQDFSALHHLLVSTAGFPMSNFMPKRIELNLNWQNEAAALGVELPAVVFEKGSEQRVMTYAEFLRSLSGTSKPKRRRSRKNAKKDK